MPDPSLKLGDYILIEKLAQGGMAEVFKAKTADPQGIERLVVIKRILPHISSNPDYVEMLIDEARIAVHFTHGNMAQIYDLGRVGDDYFIVMEYVDGKTLGQILRELKERGETIPIEIVIYAMAEVCRGLDYIHHKAGPDGRQLGVIHRDISPQNIIISRSGTVKIIDFGVAKAFEKESHTESGVLKGKFAYMSPEQADGHLLDQRSDIFSAGILLWELLTMERLFKRKGNQETLKAVRKAKVASPSARRREIPRDIDRIVLKALKKKPSGRYERASEMAEDLNRVLVQSFSSFRPVQLAEFLYRYFGPEADEEALPPELPDVAFKPPPKSTTRFPEDEETTVRDQAAKSSTSRRSFPRWVAVTIGSLVVLLFLGAGGYFTLHLTRGRLLLTVTPTSAQVSLNGEKIQPKEGVFEIADWVGSPLKLRIEKKGFVPQETTVQLKGGSSETLRIELAQEIPPFADLMIVTEPTGATIFLDDREWGAKSPAKIPHLTSEKKYKVGAFLEGYEFAEQEVNLVKGKTADVSVSLKLKGGLLTILSSPEGADVIIDDQTIGKTPYTYRTLLPEEEVSLRIALEGYEPHSEAVLLKSGEKKELNLTLKKLATAPAPPPPTQ